MRKGISLAILSLSIMLPFCALANDNYLSIRESDAVATATPSWEGNQVAGLRAGGPEVNNLSPWMFYFGIYTGSLTADFTYSGTYFANRPSNQEVGNDTFQQGYLIGDQAGIQYHFNSPYFIGLNVSIMANTDKRNEARLSSYLDDTSVVGAQSFSLDNRFRINSNVDIAALGGIDITPHTRIYMKVGASRAEFAQHLRYTRRRGASIPQVFSQLTDNQSVWGVTAGVGLSYNFYRWLSIFTEYDQYYYGHRNLKTQDGINPLLGIGQGAHLTHNVTLSSSTVKLGLNFEFNNDFYHAQQVLWPDAWWSFYFGVAGGYYSSDFHYQADYSSNRPGNNGIRNDVFQNGVLGGAQIGAFVHFRSPYYVGLEFSYLGNAEKARLSKAIDDTISAGTSFSVNNQFQINYNMDMAALFGFDLTSRTHAYLKAGASYAELAHRVTITRVRGAASPVASVQQSTEKTLWGYVVGLGLRHDIGKWFSVFAEYDYYNYPSQGLNTLDNIAPARLAGLTDRLTQRTDTTIAKAIKVGLNFKLDTHFYQGKGFRQAALPGWLIYAGALGGYYTAHFHYGATYLVSVSPGNQPFEDQAFQRGASGGGQVGGQYHFHSPLEGNTIFTVLTRWG